MSQAQNLVKIARAVALLLLISGPLCAQEYSFRTFGNADGLTNLAVRGVYQDRVGFIWVSTEDGIFRYDGERFEAFGPKQGIPLNAGAAFGEAPDGSLLVGGDFGLYQLLGNRFNKLTVDLKTVSWAQGIQSDGKGHTFIGTDSGLMELHSEPGHDAFAVKRFPQAPGTSGAGAYGVLVDGEVLWYGCGQELCRMDRNGTTVFGRDSGLPERVLQIQKDRGGNLWVRARNASVFELFAGQAKFQTPEALSQVTVGGPAVDVDGRILLPTPDGLLIRDGKSWQKIDRSAGLRGGVYAVFEDRQHSLWIGLAGRGLVQWRGYDEWRSYSTASGLASDIVYEIQPQANGTLWVATEGGLLRGERQESGIRWKKVPGLDGFPVHSVRLAPNGDLWIGTEAHGADRLHLGTGAVERFGEAQGLFGKSPYTLRFDHQQRLWAATEAGLFVAMAPYQKFSRIAELPPTRFWAVAEGNDGTVWAGGADGLFSYGNGRWKNFTRDNGLSNQEVLALGAGASGTIWVGYRFGGGIDRVHLQPGGLAVEKGVQRPGTNGLVYFLESDASGRLWAGTERGVDMWDGSRWSHYDVSDGLIWNDCDLNAFAQESDGTVWIGTSGGLSQFKPRPRLSPEEPIDVVFTKLVMGGRDVSGQSNPSASIQANSLIARYAALNVSSENRILFRYQLTGSNSTWTETTQRELQFAELAPGAYRLEIEAQGGDGVWSGHKAEFVFRILTPWYSSWWFLGICGLMPVLIVGSVVRLRMLSAQKREAARKVAELEIAGWKNRYEAAVLASGQIIFEWNPVSRQVTFGGALQEILGYSPSEFLGTTDKWRELIHHDDLEGYVEAMKQAMKSGEAYELEYRVEHGKGGYRMMREQGRVVLDESGNISKMVGFITDVSERRMLEQQLRQAQKMEAVGRLAGGVAHDFNNLLTVITGYSELLLNSTGPEGNSLRGQTEQIHAAADRAASLTRQLLAFSRQQVLQPRQLNLNTVVSNFDKLLRRLIGEDIEVLTLLAQDLGLVEVDPGQIDQVLMNLVVNARDAMPVGGKLTLETANVHVDETYAPQHLDVVPGRYVRLTVSDTGAGMTAEVRARLFEPFFTTKDVGKGTGLGLSTVYGIVKQSGGYIEVYSEPNHGTSFKIYFPHVAASGDVSGRKAQGAADNKGFETILLVEDDVQVRELAALVLTSRGYQVFSAADIEEVDAICEQEEGKIDLLVTDVVMPRMGGTEVARRVAQRCPGVRVLYMSGYTADTTVHHGVLQQGVAFLQKPFTPATLAAKVREVLDQNAQG